MSGCPMKEPLTIVVFLNIHKIQQSLTNVLHVLCVHFCMILHLEKVIPTCEKVMPTEPVKVSWTKQYPLPWIKRVRVKFEMSNLCSGKPILFASLNRSFITKLCCCSFSQVYWVVWKLEIKVTQILPVISFFTPTEATGIGSDPYTRPMLVLLYELI